MLPGGEINGITSPDDNFENKSVAIDVLNFFQVFPKQYAQSASIFS